MECGNCLFQGASKLDNTGVGIYCLFYLQWNRDSKNCGRWAEFSDNLDKNQRIKIANTKRETEIRLKQHTELLNSEKENRIFQVKIAAFSFFSGILVTFIAQYLVHLWRIK
jgi:hypothetical protein